MIWFRKKQKDNKNDHEVHGQSSCCRRDDGCDRERCGWNPFGCQRPCPPAPCCCTGPTGAIGATGATGPTGPMGPTGPTAPSIYAQHGNCRNHAAFHYLKDN